MRYTVAAIQFEPILGRADENLRRLLALIEEAAGRGARLVVAPEMAPCAYCFHDRQEIEPYVEPIPGPLTRRLAAIAGRHDCVIVCGLAEVDEESGLYYNAATVVGPDGYIGKYRKVHHFVSDAKWGVEGDSFPVWDTPAGRIGVEICNDAVYPESGRLLALQGAQVICFPTNWVGSSGCPSQRWITQAYENGVYLVAADRYGEERGVHFQGGSCIVEPDGTVQALKKTADGIVYGEIDLARTDHRRFDQSGSEDKLADRRPELYREMMQNTYGWSVNYFQTLYGAQGLPTPRQSRVGVLQFRPVLGDPGRNLDTILRMSDGSNLDLLVLPELAFDGFPGEATEPGEGGLRSEEMLLELARHTGSLIVTSLLERDAEMGCCFNTAVLAGPEGLIGRQRKRHLTRDDLSWASPSNDPFHTFDTPLGRLGLLASYDALFWESIRVLATQGADLICIPAALRWPRRQAREGCDWVYWRSKAWESYVALAVANYPGPEFAGTSEIIIPAVKEMDDVEQIAPEDGEFLLAVTLDTSSKYLREKRGLSWRRLHAYGGLVKAES